jgi:ribosomal RNA assembly protein
VRVEYVRIPLHRVGVLIGRGGGTKREIEERLGVHLEIDAREGIVTVENVGGEVLAEWTGRDIIRAIGRGFHPRKALLLSSDEYTLEIVDLEEIVGRSSKAVIRQKGRIIGEEGKTRRFIEEITGCYLSVSGSTVAIIGLPKAIRVAEEAVRMLARGIPHSVVYKVLQEKNRELKKERLSLWKGETL